MSTGYAKPIGDCVRRAHRDTMAKQQRVTGRAWKATPHSLPERAKPGTYFAPPVRRVHIPKGTGHETRPIGVPATEDKLLQRAVVMLLEPIYEQDFLECSYGFRPGRSAHGALRDL